MPHVVIAPLIFGLVIVGGGISLLIFRRPFLRRFPDYQVRGRSGTAPNSTLRIVMFGTVIVSFGLLILLSGELHLF